MLGRDFSGIRGTAGHFIAGGNVDGAIVPEFPVYQRLVRVSTFLCRNLMLRNIVLQASLVCDRFLHRYLFVQ